VVGPIDQLVQQCLDAFRAKWIKQEESTASGWKDVEDHFWECNRKYGTTELKVLVITNPNNILPTVERTAATTFSEFVNGLNQPLTAGKIPSHSRSYLRLGSKKLPANHNIDCILPINSPETL
jgi:hypothetical protein